MLMLSQAFGFILSNLCIVLAEINPTYGVVLMTFCAVIAAGCTVFVKEDLQRNKMKQFSNIEHEIKISFEEDNAMRAV